MVTYKTMIKSNYRKLANTLFFPSPLSAIDVQQFIEENINDLEVSPTDLHQHRFTQFLSVDDLNGHALPCDAVNPHLDQTCQNNSKNKVIQKSNTVSI